MRCPRCGEENPERARFCLACGGPLEAASTAAAEERKVVSVLFVDLVGFTAASDAADPEDVRARLRPYHAMLKREIERFGGTVEKFIGDAVMAVFGAPVAHEDDAERAVRAALRITEAIPELNDEQPGLELAVRAAVNTGEAVVTLGARPAEGEGFVTGDVVNTASRLQAAAPVGAVVVGEITHRATRGAVEYERLEPVTVKGKREPVLLWRAVAVRSRYGVDVERPRTPFVGREDDLSLLERTYVRMLRESSVQLVTIVGEPGVGKTRLVAEFQAFVDDRPEIVFWRQGRCLPYGEGITFWALGEIVKAQAGILESDPPEDAARKLADAVDQAVAESDREWVKTRVAPLVGTGGVAEGSPVERQEAFTAWRSFLEGVASLRPLVLVIEDVHWADDAMRAFVEELVDWGTGVPMLVLCTARPELYERDPGWGGGKRNSATVSLSPLTADDTARLIAALLDQAVLPAETQELLLERAGGNPLYTEEFIRMLVDRGFLERRGGVWAVTGGTEIPVPETVHALIAARLDTLSPERKALLQDASVLGKVFWAGAVAAMSGRPDDEVRAGLHELARKELVRPARRASVEGEAEYAFWHLLIRDVAYGQIPRASRAARHRAAAEWVEGMAGERVEDHAELLAHHYLQALELARADDDVDDLRRRAARFLTAAGDRTRNLDTTKAGAYIRRALELQPPGTAEWATGALKLVSVSWFLGEFAEGIQLAERARDIFLATGDPRAAAEARSLAALLMTQRGETQRGRELLYEAIRELEAFEPSPGLAEAVMHAAGNEMLAGNFPASRELAERGLELTRRFGMPETENRALQFIGMARLVAGDLGGVDDLDRAVEMGKEQGLGLAAVAMVNRGDWNWEFDGPAAALATFEAAIDHARRRGVRGAVNWARAESTWVLYDLGRWDEVLEVGEAVMEADPETTQLTSLVLPGRVQVFSWRGQLDRATAEAPRMLERAREIVDPQVLIPALSAGVLVAGLSGDADQAVAVATEMREAVHVRRGWGPFYLPDVLRMLVRIDRVEVVEDLVGDPALPGKRGQIYRRTNAAILAEARGELEAAAPAHLEVAGEWERFGNVVERTHALLAAGRCLTALDKVDDAREPLARAKQLAAGFGAAILAAEADELLGGAEAVSS